ncbi:hypothetical protein N0V82_007763 [Gnomoniopsis sp. IMI 355080]|nr:hypothetical protein N0V82_007763 [Gnomoniopsis sp. IMI 355080]
MPNLLLNPMWSPEYDRLLEEARTKYDAVEEARRRHSPPCPRLDFQDEIEVRLHGEEEARHREQIYSRMTDKNLPIAPLSVYLDSVLPLVTRPLHEDRLFDWRTALDRWALFRDAARSSDFLDRLSATQRSAFQTLEDWWESRYSDSALCSATKAYMESRRDLGSATVLVRILISRPATSRASLKALIYEDSEVIERTGTNKSLYHSLCFKLFCLEFHPFLWEPYQSELNLSILYTHRRQAVGFAISQHLAYSSVRMEMQSRPIGQPHVKAVMAERPWFQGAEFQERPFYLWDTTSQETVLVRDLSECPEYTCVSHTWGRWRKEGVATVPGTKWPIPQNSLYDVLELPGMLSHLGDRYIWFDLFCIPQYGDEVRMKIEISRQAAIFRNAKRCIAWINQCQNWHGVQKALKWLAHQFLVETNLDSPTASGISQEQLSAMFQGALEAVEVIHLVKKSDLEVQIGHLEPWFTSLWTLQETVLRPELELYSRHWQRLELQGSVPLTLTTFAVFLYTASLYSYPGTQRSAPVGFSSSGTYASSARQRYNPYNTGIASSQWPSGVADLMMFQIMTSLGPFLLDLSPMNVLAASQRRQFSVSEERSPAIMSAIGVTKWYERRLSSTSEPLQDPVLLNNFSLSFIREAAAKIGAEFYSRKPGLEKLLATPYSKGPCGFMSGKGTMLPFGQISPSSATGHGKFSTQDHNSQLVTVRQDHESVCGWTIMPDASVEITKVCIVSSSVSQTAVPCVSANLWFETAEDPRILNPTCLVSLERMDLADEAKLNTKVAETLQATKRLTSELKNSHIISSPGDLSQHLRDISRCGVLYAVCLQNDSWRNHAGILLAEVPEQKDTSWKLLVKVGHYSATGIDLPISTSDVRWKVL